jgi:hypothetical protein
MKITGDELVARPVTRPGEIVEAAPGAVAIEHSDGGKANQYYLRGYNLDHGTDMATYVDDVPINLRASIPGAAIAVADTGGVAVEPAGTGLARLRCRRALRPRLSISGDRTARHYQRCFSEIVC